MVQEVVKSRILCDIWVESGFKDNFIYVQNIKGLRSVVKFDIDINKKLFECGPDFRNGDFLPNSMECVYIFAVVTKNNTQTTQCSMNRYQILFLLETCQDLTFDSYYNSISLLCVFCLIHLFIFWSSDDR